MADGIPIVTGTRVRIRHKHAHAEGAGEWGTVRERHGKHIIVMYDGAKRGRREHIANVVEKKRTADTSGVTRGDE